MKQGRESTVYSAFAEIYDQVMRDVDYPSWAQHVINLAERYEIQVNKILELACGTASMAIRLSEMGYDIVGIDRSEGMLQEARNKARLMDEEIPFYRASMEDFSALALSRDFDLILCLYDSLNYLLDEKEVQATFSQIYDHLHPDGAFIFDVTTEFNLLHNFSGFTFAENFPNASYIWENDYDIVNKICTSKVTIFTNTRGEYKKTIEMHKQKVYSNAFLTESLELTGFEILGMFHNLTEKPMQKNCERIHFVCKKRQ